MRESSRIKRVRQEENKDRGKEKIGKTDKGPGKGMRGEERGRDEIGKGVS